MTNPLKVKYDYFSVTVISSQEELSAYCSYSALSLIDTSKMSEGINY
jgi:hypothetical protein